MVYNWFEEKILIDGCELTSYGITADTGKGQIIVKDITLEKESIITLVDAFNQNELSIIHFEDAIEQFLYEFST